MEQVPKKDNKVLQEALDTLKEAQKNADFVEKAAHNTITEIRAVIQALEAYRDGAADIRYVRDILWSAGYERYSVEEEAMYLDELFNNVDDNLMKLGIEYGTEES